MHHFIYPSQDTFITNTVDFQNLNFGLDETLRVGTEDITSKIYFPTTVYPFASGSFVTNINVQGFSGSLSTASFYGSASSICGYVFDTDVDPVSFTVDYFSGSFIGSIDGWVNGIPYSSSNSSGSLDGFSGSIVIHPIASGSTWSGIIFNNYVNWFSTWNMVTSGSGAVNGLVSGSFSSSFFGIFNGSIENLNGQILVGNIINGEDTWNFPHTEIVNGVYLNRALVQFDITKISESIANGDIVNPTFKLRLYVAREFDLPIQYSVYAFPISESWIMGNGYVSDNGSLQGASWVYRDYSNGTPWAVTGSSYIQSLGITQSFNYQVGDIYMDITPIVNTWLSGTVPNNGIVLISSDEFSPTGSGMSLRFFSKDTNTIYEPILDVGWSDFSWSTGSVITSSANISTIPAGISGSVSDSGSISGFIFGCFTGIGNISISSSIDPISGSSGSFITNSYASGLIQATGLSGLITSMSIDGDFVGIVTSSIVRLTKKCRSCKPHGMGRNDTDFSSPFYPGAGDDEAYLVNSNEDFWVIDGQFPSMYGPNLNIPSFITSQLSYLNGGQDQSQYQGHDIYGWGHAFNTFNQYDWTSDHVYQEEFGQGSNIFLNGQPCNCSNQQGVGPYSYSSSLYNCANGDPCIQSAIATSCINACDSTLLITMSLIMGTFTDGIFSGSIFTSSFCNGYLLGRGFLIGNWNEAMIDGTIITSSVPFSPFSSGIVVSFDGNYFNGSAFGSIMGLPLTNSYSLYSYGIFSGIFIDGPLAGYKIYAPFSGSILSSSYSYTSSLNLTSLSLSPVDVRNPFATVVQNIPSSVNDGDIIKVNVFARPQFPLKNFDRQTQFTQFLIPQYLPTSSYYAIKDNETEQIILGFDNYTQISCDPNGNYFLLDTTSFPQERYFKILIRVEQSGSKYTFDKGNIFKIVR